jgi:hypothetical protein
VKIRVACPATAGACTGTLYVRRSGKIAGRSVFAIDGGKSEVVSVALATFARKGKTAALSAIAYSRDDLGLLAVTIKSLKVTLK